MVDLIHIGDYKTGTTWWQREVFRLSSEIYYLDNPDQHPEIVALRNKLLDLRDLDFNEASIRKGFIDASKNIGASNKIIAMSCEAFSGRYPNGDYSKCIAERLRKVFGKIKIVIVIREQFSMLKAIYSEYVKMGGALSFVEFIFDPVASPGLIEKLKYHKIIDVYKKLFGPGHVFVGLFEAFKEDDVGFARRVLEFAGCSERLSMDSGKYVVNRSLTRVGVEVQRFINRFLRNDYNPRMPLIPPDRLVSFFLPAHVKKRLIDNTRTRLVYDRPGFDDKFVLRYAINFAITHHVSRFCERLRFGPRLTVPEDVKIALKDEFLQSNRILRDRHGLDVERWGWRL